MNVFAENALYNSNSTIEEICRRVCGLLSSGHEKEEHFFREKVGDFCISVAKDKDIPSVEQGREWIEIGALAGNTDCIQCIDHLNIVEDLKPLISEEFFEIVSEPFPAACFQNALHSLTSPSRCRRWLEYGCQEEHDDTGRCSIAIRNLDRLTSLLDGLEDWHFSIVLERGKVSEMEYICFQIALNRKTMSLEKTLICLKEAGEAIKVCKRLYSIFLSLKPIGNIEWWELMYMADSVLQGEEDEERSSHDIAGEFCYRLSFDHRQNNVTRCIEWIQLGKELNNLKCDTTISLLSLFGESLSEIRHLQLVVHHAHSTCRSLISLASYSSSLSDALKWLHHHAKDHDPQGKVVLSLCEAGLKSVMAKIQYERDELIYEICLIRDFKSTYLSLMNEINHKETISYRFLTTSLLFGSLVKNEISSLYRSFFMSSLREVHLLPLIVSFLYPLKRERKEGENRGGEEERKRESVEKGKRENEEERKRERENEEERKRESEVMVRSLEDICRLFLLGDLSHITSLSFSFHCFPTNYLSTFYPLLLSRLPSLLSLSYHHVDESDELLDLSWLCSLDSSHLKKLEIHGHYIGSLSFLSSLNLSHLHSLSLSHIDDSHISDLSHCDFMNLKELKIFSSVIPTLFQLATWKNFSPFKLSIVDCVLSDISSLSLLDLSLLEEPLDFSDNSLSDLTPLREVRYPIGVLIRGNRKAVEKVTEMERSRSSDKEREREERYMFGRVTVSL